MKKLVLSVLVLVGATLVFLMIQGSDLREIRTEIEINAPIEAVWGTMIKVDRWSDWSPIIKRAHGIAALGNQLDITMISEEGKNGKDGPNYKPVVTELSSPHRFKFQATMGAGFVFTNYKVLELEKTPTGTRLIHKEQFQGMMAPIMWNKIKENVPSMLESMNEALKILIE